MLRGWLRVRYHPLGGVVMLRCQAGDCAGPAGRRRGHRGCFMRLPAILAVLFAGAMLSGMSTGAFGFDCAKKYCREMSSCAEARYQFETCGYHNLDGDNDGVPCENVCGQSPVEERGDSARPPALPFVAPLDKATPNTGSAASEHGLITAPTPAPEATSEAAWVCGSKRRCTEMQSCEEARFYLTKCGVRSLDRDRDGVPCESLCGKH